MGSRQIIKQPTGKVQDRHDGYVFLECPDCGSQGRFWEQSPILNNSQRFLCHKCRSKILVTWNKEHKEPKAHWGDSYYISTNAKVRVAGKEEDEDAE